MNKNKLHKLDKIFIFGSLILSLLGGIIDAFYWKDSDTGFPVFSIYGIIASCILLVILLFYSAIACKQEDNRPEFVNWYMLFVLPYVLILIPFVGIAIANFVIKTFGI